MALVQRVRQPWYSRNRDYVADDAAATDAPVASNADYGMSVAARIIWLVAGIILALLAFRFVFSLLGANPANSFANFIYTVSHPFVAPFFGLFHYNVLNLGVAHFEIYTLVAMAVYAVIAWILVALVNVGRRY